MVNPRNRNNIKKTIISESFGLNHVIVDHINPINFYSLQNFIKQDQITLIQYCMTTTSESKNLRDNKGQNPLINLHSFDMKTFYKTMRIPKAIMKNLYFIKIFCNLCWSFVYEIALISQYNNLKPCKWSDRIINFFFLWIQR